MSDWRPFKHFCSGLPQYGLNVPASDYMDTGTRFIRTSDVNDRGEMTGVEPVYVNDSLIGPSHRLIEGDLLLSRSGTLGRCLRYRRRIGKATFAGYLIRFRPNDEGDPRYLEYCTQSKFFQQAIEGGAPSSTISNFNAERYANLQLPWWPFEQQRAIADYLDIETGRIDALTSKKRRMIELLEERRSNYVSQAVTSGLKRQCKFVDTGNQYVPQIPKGWRLMRLRHVVDQIIDTPHKTAPVVDEPNYLVVRTANVKKGRLVLNEARYTDRASWMEWNRRGEPRLGDVMFTREAPAGEACVVPPDTPLCIGQRMVLLRVNQAVVCGEWVVHSIYSKPVQRFIADLSNATTVAHINMSDIPDIPVSVPDLSQQQETLTHIRSEICRQEEAGSKLRRQIDFLGERRKALITAAVTGEFTVPKGAV